MSGIVVAVHRSSVHAFGKDAVAGIELVAAHGVRDDAHFGITVQHRSRVAKDPTQPNLRQVHLLHAELLDELGTRGFAIGPGQLGENITTRGIDLLGLSAGALIRLGDTAIIRVTGLRNPCRHHGRRGRRRLGTRRRRAGREYTRHAHALTGRLTGPSEITC